MTTNINKKERIATLIDELINKYHFKTLTHPKRKESKYIWYYDKETGKHVNDGGIIIEETLEKEIGMRLNNADVSQALNKVRRCTYVNSLDT